MSQDSVITSDTIQTAADTAASVIDTVQAAADTVQAVVDSVSVSADSIAAAASTAADSSVTIKSMLASYESEILIIFAILVYSVIAFKVISVIISAIKAGKAEKTAPAAPVSAPAPADSGRNAGSVKLTDVDEKTAALAMAIVAHESDIPVDQLIFKSVRAID